ncbi:isopenicillin-N N-acyltransferase [Sarocladium strictum]
MILRIRGTADPFETGFRHGTQAKAQIASSLCFYTNLFLSKASLDWPAVLQASQKFLPVLQRQCPHLPAEMEGIAQGAGVHLYDILALNVRTEIAMGLFSDGCSSLFCQAPGVLAQNWDWEVAQRENLVVLEVPETEGRPALAIVTEAGIVGKIGLNGKSVGVCLNAIRARGVDFERLPVHIALRLVLEENSYQDAVKRVKEVGVAASSHILIASPDEALGIECSHADMQFLPPVNGVYTHANHWLVKHTTSTGQVMSEAVFVPDSPLRQARLDELLAANSVSEVTEVAMGDVEDILKDEVNYPGSICRDAGEDGKGLTTLFSIIMDLRSKIARVKIGRTTEAIEDFVLRVQ